MNFLRLFLFASVLATLGCSAKRPAGADLINQEASLPPGLPFDPLQERVITSGASKTDSLM